MPTDEKARASRRGSKCCPLSTGLCKSMSPKLARHACMPWQHMPSYCLNPSALQMDRSLSAYMLQSPPLPQHNFAHCQAAQHHDICQDWIQSHGFHLHGSARLQSCPEQLFHAYLKLVQSNIPYTFKNQVMRGEAKDHHHLHGDLHCLVRRR